MVIEIVSYIITVSLATIIPPFTAVPLELSASTQFGLFGAFAYTILGDLIGAIVVFLVTRKYGWRLVRKLFDEEKVIKARKFLHKYTFWQITLSRTVFASIWDVLSFACGLTDMTVREFMLSSLISSLPSTALIILFGKVIDINFAFMVWLSVGIFVIAMYITVKGFTKKVKK